MEVEVFTPVYFDTEVDELSRCLDSINADEIDLGVHIFVDGPISPQLRKYIIHRADVDSTVRITWEDINRGIGYARYFGLVGAKSKYLAFLDSDDVATPLRFMTQFKFLESNPGVDICGGYISELYGNNLSRTREVPITDAEISSSFGFRQSINNTTVMLRLRSLSFDLRPLKELRYLEDLWLWSQCARQGLRFANIPEVFGVVSMDRELFGRRRGFKYAVAEIRLSRAATERFRAMLWFIYALKFLARLLPSWMLRVIYIFTRR